MMGLARTLRSSVSAALWQSIPNRMHRRMFRSQKWVEIEEDLLHILADPNRASVDAGANMGRFTAALAACTKKVYAFEPDPAHAAWITRARYRNVVVADIALSNAAATKPYYVPVFAGKSVVTTASLEAGLHSGRVETRAVETGTLDQLADQDIGFVKIDVEGHEAAVLAGSRELVERQRPTFLVEAEDRHRAGAVNAVRRFFDEMGYVGRFVFEGKTRRIDELTPDMLDESELRRPVNRVAMRYVNNFIFFPNAQAAQQGADAIDAALADPA